MAIQIGVGNLGGVSISHFIPPLDSHSLSLFRQAMASNFYRQKDKPRYILGHALELGFIGLGIVAGFVLVFGYRTINKKRQRVLARGPLTSTPEELSALGDKAVTFRYIY